MTHQKHLSCENIGVVLPLKLLVDRRKQDDIQSQTQITLDPSVCQSAGKIKHALEGIRNESLIPRHSPCICLPSI